MSHVEDALLDAIVKEYAIGQTGQRIVQGLVFERFQMRLAVANVAQYRNPMIRLAGTARNRHGMYLERINRFVRPQGGDFTLERLLALYAFEQRAKYAVFAHRQMQMAQRAAAHVGGGIARNARETLIDEGDTQRVCATDVLHNYESFGGVLNRRSEQAQLLVGLFQFVGAFGNALFEPLICFAQFFFQALALKEFGHDANVVAGRCARAATALARISGDVLFDACRGRHDEATVLPTGREALHFCGNERQAEAFLAPSGRVTRAHDAHRGIAAFVLSEPGVRFERERMIVEEIVTFVGCGARLWRDINESPTRKSEMDRPCRKVVDRIADSHLLLERAGVGLADRMRQVE